MSPHNSQHAVIPNSNTPPRIKFSGGRLSLLPVLLLLSLLALSPLAAPVRADALTKGDDGVYLIATPADLRAFRDGVNSGDLVSADARLTADIDLSSADGTPEEWTPIGDGHNGTQNSVGEPNYRGAFDGAGHTVGGYKITTNNKLSVGFFGHIGTGGRVTGLTVSGKINKPKVMVGDKEDPMSYRAGGIAGQNVGTISNCVNTGTVTNGAGDVGGIAGVNGSNPLTGTISNCVNRGDVTNLRSNGAIGGIVGVNGNYGTMSNCVNYGDIYGSDLAESGGGIAGKNNGGTITNCVNYNTVSGSRYAGGVVGYTIYYTNTTSNCVNYGDVSSYPIGGESQIAGGVVGWHEKGTLSNCVSVGGNVTNTKGDGTASAGGVVGTCGKEAKISNCGWLYSQVNSKGVGSGDVTPEPVSLDQTGIEKSVVALFADPMNITLRTGDTAKITLNALPGIQAAFGEYVKNITVLPDSEKISAKVNEENGEITLTSLKEGTSALSVSVDLYTTDLASLNPSVDPVPLSLTIYVSARRTLGGITLSPEKMNLRVGESGKFTATVTAEDAADQTINWHSSNEKIATVDNEGNVKALAVGEATITAMTADGKHDAAAKVTVANRHSGGNGCAAGVGALALFALIPLLLRKKKS